MRITTKLTIAWDGTVLEHDWYEYDGPLALCSGGNAGQEAEANQAAQASFYNELTNSFSQEFGAQSAITNALTSAYEPILKGGPNQYGFSPGEQSALSSQALQGSSAAAQQAEQATGSELAAHDSTGLPSGVADELRSQIGDVAAQDNANEQLGIKQAGYQQGYNEFNHAAQVLAGTASLENPSSYARDAVGAGQSDTAAIKEVQQANTSPWLSVLGGALGMGASLLTGGVLGGGSGGSGGGAASSGGGSGTGQWI